MSTEIPPDLRNALEQEAEKEQVTVNDVAGRVLASHYGLEWPDSGNPYRPLSTLFKLHVTEEIRRALGQEAFTSGYTMRGVSLNLLAAHYGTNPIDPNRRPRKELVQ